MKNENGTDSQLLSILESHQFFGPSDWETIYNIKPGAAKLPIPLDDLEKIMNGPCPFVRGKKVKETHFLMFIPGQSKISIRTLQTIYPRSDKPKFYSYLANCDADDNQPYANEKIEKDSWFLIFKGIVPHSRYENYDEQLTMLPDSYDLPQAIVITAFHFSIYEKNKAEVSMEANYGRTKSFHYNGKRIFVSGIEFEQIFICAAKDEKRNADLGLYAVKEL